MIILASKSPRRQELLKLITDEFKIEVTDVDETLPEGITPSQAVLTLSKIKALPLKSNKNYDDIIIGADTVVSIDGKILGKPQNKQHAKEMLKSLSGKTHSVFTGVTLIKGEKELSFFEETKVTFHSLSDNEIDEYIKTNEPMDKAGAYGIQGYGALLVEKIEGDFFNVVGLPVSRINRELKTLNV